MPPAQDAPASQAAPSPAGAPRTFLPPPSSPSGGMVSLNFNRADLVEIIHIIAQQLRLTYTIDPEVKGSVTINSAEPLRAEDLLPVFHQVLRMNGAVAVRRGNLYHIMPIKDGKGLARPAGRSKEDSFALQVVPVRFFAAAEMKRVLTPFLQPGGEIIEYPRGNFLIIMDLASNIQRLIEIADLVDVQVFAGTRMEVYQPKVASAEELAQELTKIMQSFAASAPQAESFTAQFIALPRINQLLVISHSEAAWTYAKRWLDRIDIVAEGPGRRIFIYPVENGKATELADVLSQALGHPSTGRRDTTRTLQDFHRSTTATGTPGMAGRGTTTSPFGSSGSFGQQSPAPLGAYATIPVPGQVAPPTQPGIAPPVPGVARPPLPTQPPTTQAQQQQEQLRIVPDPATNSLIIYGTAQEFQNIRNILKDLDAIPRQVLIEAMVLQVDLSDTESLGVDYEILRRSRVTIFGQTFNSRGALRSLDKFPVAPAFGSGLTGIFGGSDVQALVNALMTDSRVKLLSSPSVLAADNRPARIQVGSEEPIPTGTINAAVGAATPSSSTTIQYRNTGRILTIIPQVNSKGLVNLQIKAEVSQRGDDVPFGTNETFPSFNTQDAETTAVVHDGETLVIGGLIGERKIRSRSGIPYLMDIPVFGRFFGTTSDESTRTELIMLITPSVIRNQSESQQVTEDFKSKVTAVRNELERIERDRAKSQPKTAPEAPNSVEPKADDKRPPPPARSRLVPRTGASLEANDGLVGGLSRDTAQAGPAALESRAPGAGNPPADPSPTNEGAAENSSPPPAYILSLTRQAPAPVIPVRPAPEPQKERKPAAGQWAVQVASLAGRNDAEAIASGLREGGYEAYVLTAQVEGKTWHRVRVGQFSDLRAAKHLKESLVNKAHFQDAYIAAN
ncbi:MAG: type II secretion system secretin GspD [Candidatus Binatia bacterium]